MIRESIQNSYDAQATTIDFRLMVNERVAVELSVDDGGIGIDRYALENVHVVHGWVQKTRAGHRRFRVSQSQVIFLCGLWFGVGHLLAGRRPFRR